MRRMKTEEGLNYSDQAIREFILERNAKVVRQTCDKSRNAKERAHTCHNKV